jgi:hypothetical protein
LLLIRATPLLVHGSEEAAGAREVQRRPIQTIREHSVFHGFGPETIECDQQRVETKMRKESVPFHRVMWENRAASYETAKSHLALVSVLSGHFRGSEAEATTVYHQEFSKPPLGEDRIRYGRILLEVKREWQHHKPLRVLLPRNV